MRNTFYCLVILLVTFLSVGGAKAVSAVSATVKGSLPSQVAESSGLDFTGGSSFWTHNDGYGDNNLYKVSNTGMLTRTVTVTGAINQDWEDLAHDAGRNYMFIGDFGNNNCDRTNLRIYKITHPSLVAGTTVAAQTINFTYPDQNRFPANWLNFDVEAFFHFNGKLYLFTKADGNAVGYTKMYSVPDAPGSYVATLVDSFYTNDRTTSADISPDGKTVILLANSRIHLFRNFNGDKFLNGQHTLISIGGGWTQKEAVSFWSNNEIYLSDENNGSGNKLYYIDLSPWIPSFTTGINDGIKSDLPAAFPNPCADAFSIELGNSGLSNTTLQLYDLTGKMVREAVQTPGETSLRMDVQDLTSGVYFYKVLSSGRELKAARLLIQH